MLIVWDRLPAHRGRLVREFIELSEGHIVTEYLPACPPGAAPHAKQTALGHGLLESVFSLLRLTRYYASRDKRVTRGIRSTEGVYYGHPLSKMGPW